MFARSGKLLIIIALAVMLGAHWTLLQTVAWTTMLTGNLQGSSFCDAVVKTFDGKHPCCLCRAIAAGKKSEQKNEFTGQYLKLEFPPVEENPAFVAPLNFQLLPQLDLFAESLSQKPPTPPPRSLSA